jgi:hypothetical protein
MRSLVTACSLACAAFALGWLLASSAGAQDDSPPRDGAPKVAPAAATEQDAALPDEPAPAQVSLDVPVEGSSPQPLQSGEPSANEAEMQAQLDAILTEQTGAQEASSDAPSLHLYGFADAMFAKSYPQIKDSPYPPKYGRFMVGNVNLYAAADLTHGFSSLIEVRFTYMPSGNVDSETLRYESTEAIDHSDFQRVQRWGGIILERVHLDYSFAGWLNLRIGSFLTPYGIWNVDHGSPTIIPVVKPYAIGEQLFPTRQIGVAGFGSVLLRDTTLGYHLTVSNGRSDIDELEFDRNKAVGGRLYLSRANVGTFTFGLSAYGGEGNRGPSIRVLSVVPLRTSDAFQAQFKELAVGADVLWEWRSLRLQAELISRQVNYRDPFRPTITTVAQATPQFVPDFHAWGSYVLVAYRLPWFGVMPYFVFNQFERGFGGPQVVALSGTSTTSAMGVSAGVNVRPVPAVALKAQFMYAWVPDAGKQYTQPQLSFQAAWAF